MELGFVIAADRGVMTDEKTGRILNWANVHYLTDYREDTEDATGFKPIKVSCSPESFDLIRAGGPGLYKLEFKTRPGAGGKPTLTLTRADAVGHLDLFDLSNYRKQQQPQPSKAV